MPQVRALVYAPDRQLLEWIDRELGQVAVIVQVAISVRQVVRALVDDPPPRAQLLIADIANMSAIDVLHLHQIRDRGWFGAILAIGRVSSDLSKSLRVDKVVRPCGTNALRNTVEAIGLDRPTVRIARLDG